MPAGARPTHEDNSIPEFSEDSLAEEGFSHSGDAHGRFEDDGDTLSPESSFESLSDDEHGRNNVDATTLDTSDDLRRKSGTYDGRDDRDASESYTKEISRSLDSSPDSFVSAKEERGMTGEDSELSDRRSRGLSDDRGSVSEDGPEDSYLSNTPEDSLASHAPDDSYASHSPEDSHASNTLGAEGDSRRSIGSDVESQGRSGDSSTGLAIIVRVLEVLILMTCLVLMFLVAFTPLGRGFFLFDIDGLDGSKYIFGVWGFCKYSWLE